MTSDNDKATEKFLTIAEAAASLGIQVFKLDRAARAGLIPIYFIYNRRRLVRLSEVVAVIENSRVGGDHD